MKKSVLAGIIMGVFLLIGLGYFVMPGFFDFSSDSQVSSTPVSELILDVSDLAEGYKLDYESPREISDVRKEGIERGWIEGHYAGFSEGGGTLDYGTWIYQTVSRYPFDNVPVDMKIPEIEEFTYEEISINVGDESLAYKVTLTEEISGEEFEKSHYRIEFTKKDIYINIMITGRESSIELLTELAEKIESRI